jgi:hypothetical protein
VQRVFTSALDGFVAEMTRTQALRTSRDPRVAYVEQDAVVRLSQTQTPATWGLDRIDQRSLPLTASGQTFFATVKLVTLTWTGATSQYMSLFRDGGNIGAAANTGSFTDLVMTSGGTIVYKVCEDNTTACSNTASVTF